MNSPNHVKALFKIEFESLEDAEIIFKSIEPELKSAPSNRSSVTASLDGNVMHLKIDAEDTHIFRASLNSYLRWILLSHEMGKLNIS